MHSPSAVRILGAVGLALALACGGDRASLVQAGAVPIDSVLVRFGGNPLAADGVDLDSPALDSLGGFARVTLPDYWPLGRRRRGLDGWYRAQFEIPRAETDWSLAIDGNWDSLAVFVNGARLVRSVGSERPAPVPLLAMGAFLVPLPHAVLHAGKNEIAIHFVARADEICSLGTLTVGPASLLASAHRNMTFWTATLPRLLALFALACGLLILMLSRWSLTAGTVWFGLGTTFWSVGALFAPLAPSASSLLGTLNSTAAHAFPPCIAIGFLRARGSQRVGIEAALVASIFLGAAIRLAVSPLWIPFVDNTWWIVDVAIGAYAVPYAFGAARRGALPAPRIVLTATVVVLAAGVVDLASLITGRAILGFSLFAAASPMIALATAAGVVSSLSLALEQARRLNSELEQRVEEKRRELDASYLRTALLERDRAIAAERARMMRDMHDGTGGQLVSALAMVEGGEAPREELAEVLREALSDLRLVIDSLEPGVPDLLALLAHARARLEPRLERHGLHFEWKVEDVPAPARFGPEQSLHVMRVFQEAVTNAVKHARATTISIRTGTASDGRGRDCTFIEVADDGCGFDRVEASQASGRGLRNMRRRAEELGAELVVESVAAGTVVRLMLPLRA